MMKSDGRFKKVEIVFGRRSLDRCECGRDSQYVYADPQPDGSNIKRCWGCGRECPDGRRGENRRT